MTRWFRVYQLACSPEKLQNMLRCHLVSIYFQSLLSKQLSDKELTSESWYFSREFYQRWFHRAIWFLLKDFWSKRSWRFAERDISRGRCFWGDHLIFCTSCLWNVEYPRMGQPSWDNAVFDFWMWKRPARCRRDRTSNCSWCASFAWSVWNVLRRLSVSISWSRWKCISNQLLPTYVTKSPSAMSKLMTLDKD